jgi:hypothetical protein
VVTGGRPSPPEPRSASCGGERLDASDDDLGQVESDAMRGAEAGAKVVEGLVELLDEVGESGGELLSALT